MKRLLFSVLRSVPVVAAALALSSCADDASVPSGARAADAAPAPVVVPVVVQDRFAVTRSRYDAETTLARLLEALDRRELTVFAVIDHAAGAQSVGTDLPFSTVVVFGDPAAGTPLIRSVPLMGAVLPLRALVYEQGDEVFLAVTGLNKLARDLPLDGQAGIVAEMAEALDGIREEVTGE